MDATEIRPRVMRNAILFTVGCLLFTIVGLWLIFSGNEEYLLPGIVAVAFFGGGWLLAFPNLIKRKVTMILTPEAIELSTPQGTAGGRKISPKKCIYCLLFISIRDIIWYAHHHP